MNRPAPAGRAIASVAALEVRLALRRGENLLVTAVVPPVVLVFFATAVPLAVPGPPVDFLLPGAIALGLIATGMVSLGIATAYERHYGVLKRLAGAPLPRSGILVAKAVSVVLVEAVQVTLLVTVAVALGWQPRDVSPGVAVLALALGTVAFCGLGLAMAGRLRAEATLAVANGLFLACLLVGGIVVPVDHLPAPIAAVAGALPAAALTDVLRAALGGPVDSVPWSLGVLAAWAFGGAAAAVRWFRWH